MGKHEKAKTGETQDQYRQRIIDIVCALMSEGQSLRQICKNTEGIPSHSAILLWLRENEAFANQYARAREMLTDVRFDEFLEAPREIAQRYIDLGWRANDAVAIARLECDNMKWALSKLNAKKYGDRMLVGNDPDNPFANMSDEQLMARLEALRK